MWKNEKYFLLNLKKIMREEKSGTAEFVRLFLKCALGLQECFLFFLCIPR